jgi:hypothetical protein
LNTAQHLVGTSHMQHLGGTSHMQVLAIYIRTLKSARTPWLSSHLSSLVAYSSFELNIITIFGCCCTSIMEGTRLPDQDSTADPGSPTLEAVVGILALILALAAVAVAIIQVHQARAARVRQTDTESQTATELSRTSSAQQHPAQVHANAPVTTLPRRYFATSRRFRYSSDFALKSNH